jgi:DNA-binding NarL/FixJ family response regulator
MAVQRTIRVLLVGDAAGCAPMLRAQGPRSPRMVFEGPVPATSGPRVLTRGATDVVVVDVGRDELAGTLADLRRVDPHVRVLVRGIPDPSFSSIVLGAGGCGVVPGSLDAAGLREAVLRAHAGELVLDDADLRSLLRRLADARALHVARGVRSLTARELEVLRSLAEGRSTAEIAEQLVISPTTVQSHVKNVLAKLGVHSKVEAVRVAWREGLAAVPA